MRSSKGEHGPVLIDFLLHINGDMSERVMSIIESRVPALEVYSIDEAFADLTGIPESLENLSRTLQTEINYALFIKSEMRSVLYLTNIKENL